MSKRVKVNFHSSLTLYLSDRKDLEAKGMGIGAVLPNFRVLVTGKGMGPSMFAICELLGKDECLNRIEKGLNSLPNN